jgi:hypothetical protein
MNRNSEQGYLIRSVLTLLLLFTMTITAIGCHKETEEDKIRKVIIAIQKAAEEKEIKKIVSNLSEDYNDPQGNNY